MVKCALQLTWCSVWQSTHSVPTTYDDYVETVRERMRSEYELVREYLGIAAERNKRYYDAKVRPIPYSEGDRVYYYNPCKYAGRSEKWARKYTPCTIVKILTPVTVLLRRSKNSRAFVSHLDKIKPCFEDENSVQTKADSKIQIPPPSSPSAAEHGWWRSKRTIKPPNRLIHC